jgi:parvulin-like peptidyl-prolyl isomerase
MRRRFRFFRALIAFFACAAPLGIAPAPSFAQDAPTPAEAPQDGPPGAGADDIAARFPGGEVTAEEWRQSLRRAGILSRLNSEGAASRAIELLVSAAYGEWTEALATGADLNELDDPWRAAAEAEFLHQELQTLRRAYTGAPVGREFSEDEIRAEFEAARPDRSQPLRVSFRYIFLKGKSPEKRAQAEEVLGLVLAAPDNFNDIADDHSEATLKPPSMIVGPTPEKGMFPAMADALFRELQPGAVSEVMELPTGYAILKLVERQEPFQPDFSDQERKLAVSRLERRERDARLMAEIDRLRPTFEAQKPEGIDFARMEPREDASWPEGAPRFPVVKALLARDMRFARDEKEWTSAWSEVARLRAERDALLALLGTQANVEESEQRRQNLLREQMRLALAYEQFKPSAEDAQQIHDSIVERLRMERSVFRGRVLRLQPAHRANAAEARAEGQVVPMMDVWNELMAIRARVESHELSFEEAVRQFDTEPDNRERGGLVSTADPSVPEPIKDALRRGAQGVITKPVRLEDGLALVLPEAEDVAYPSEPSAFAWMVEILVRRAKAREALAAHREWFRANVLEIDEAAAQSFLDEWRAELPVPAPAPEE